MGASESLLAIRGNALTTTIPGFLPGLEGLIYLDVYKITVPGLTGGSYKVLNSSGVIEYQFSNPEYEILFENGESTLLVKYTSDYSYNVLSQGGYYQIGQFGPRNTRGMKGSFPRNLDVRMKVGVLLAAVQVSKKVESGGRGGSRDTVVVP